MRDLLYLDKISSNSATLRDIFYILYKIDLSSELVGKESGFSKRDA